MRFDHRLRFCIFRPCFHQFAGAFQRLGLGDNLLRLNFELFLFGLLKILCASACAQQSQDTDCCQTKIRHASSCEAQTAKAVTECGTGSQVESFPPTGAIAAYFTGPDRFVPERARLTTIVSTITPLG